MEENDEMKDIDVCELTKNLHINFCAAGKIPLTKELTGDIIFTVILVHTRKCGRNPRGGAYKWQS